MPASTNTGTIAPLEKGKPKGKCRKWMLSVSLGKDPVSGKYIRKSRRFNGTYSDAQAALQEFSDQLQACETEVRIPKKSYTYDEFVDLFIEVREASGDIAPGTIKREKDKLRSLGFRIGSYDLKDITPLVIDQAYADLKTGKSRSGKRLSGTYISDINKKLSLMMRYAVKNGYIKNNPCEVVEAPKEDTQEKRSLRASHVQYLISRLNPAHIMECGLLLCVTLGLRRGEIVGLSWEDVDFENRTIHVCHSYDDDGNMNKPKTKAGDRFLPMPEITEWALRVCFATQSSLYASFAPDLLERDEQGSFVGLVGHAPVMSDRFGNRYHPSSFGSWWKKNRAGFKLEGWKLHELRHTFLTLAAEQGVHPSVMQKLAGHSTSRITMEIYTHVNMEAQRDAMDCMQQVFKRQEV